MVVPESYVDVNIFIYWLGRHPAFGEKAYQWIKNIEASRKVKYITSTLTVYETLVIIAGLTGNSLRDKLFVEGVINALVGIQNLVITPFTLEDGIEAVSLMDEYGIDYEDALHLAIALRNKVGRIISNDKDFDKTPLKRVF
jgi:predicted nucleic acid-binding protein